MTQLEALKMIAKRDGGILTPAAVIEAARPEESPLHGAFTWDDTEAAAKWRVHEAQHLIRSFRVEVDRPRGGALSVPVFIGVSADRDGEAKHNPYRFSEDIANDEDLLACAEADALDQLKAVKARFDYIKRLGAVWEAIDAAEKGARK